MEVMTSSVSLFLGKRSGCWHRLRGADGSPHRVPLAVPPTERNNTQLISDDSDFTNESEEMTSLLEFCKADLLWESYLL